MNKEKILFLIITVTGLLIFLITSNTPKEPENNNGTTNSTYKPVSVNSFTDEEGNVREQIMFYLVVPGTSRKEVERALAKVGGLIVSEVTNIRYHNNNPSQEKLIDEKTGGVVDVYQFTMPSMHLDSGNTGPASRSFFPDVYTLESEPFAVTVSWFYEYQAKPEGIEFAYSEDLNNPYILFTDGFANENTNIVKINLKTGKSSILYSGKSYGFQTYMDARQNKLFIYGRDFIKAVDLSTEQTLNDSRFTTYPDWHVSGPHIFKNKIAFSISGDEYGVNENEGKGLMKVIIYDTDRNTIETDTTISDTGFIDGWKLGGDLWISGSAPRDCGYYPYLSVFDTSTSTKIPYERPELLQRYRTSFDGSYAYVSYSFVGDLPPSSSDEEMMCNPPIGKIEVVDSGGNSNVITNEKLAYESHWLPDNIHLLYKQKSIEEGKKPFWSLYNALTKEIKAYSSSKEVADMLEKNLKEQGYRTDTFSKVRHSTILTEDGVLYQKNIIDLYYNDEKIYTASASSTIMRLDFIQDGKIEQILDVKQNWLDI